VGFLIGIAIGALIVLVIVAFQLSRYTVGREVAVSTPGGDRRGAIVARRFVPFRGVVVTVRDPSGAEFEARTKHVSLVDAGG